MRPASGSTVSACVGYPGPSKSDFRSASALAPFHHSLGYLSVLERALFRRQFVLIGEDNKRVGTVDSLDAARAALADGTAASAGGRLVQCLLAADIDAENPLIGDACAEALIAWCVRHGLPYLLRDSGRAGGRHLVVLITGAEVPVDEWSKLCRKVSDRWGGVVTDRTGMVLRLLTAPHRLGLASPVIACTITPRAVQDAAEKLFGTRSRRPEKSMKGLKAKPGRRSRTFSDDTAATEDRSADEFGVVCACARRGYTGTAAWKKITAHAPDGHAAERGERWFRRYMWLEAVTIDAAERGLSEEAAWERARQACPTACRQKGRRWWRGLWERARDEARLDRPRRYLLPGEENTPDPAVTAEIETLRRGMAAAVDVEYADLDPRRRHSAKAVFWQLAAAIVKRGGSISIRKLAERAHLDPGTVESALRTAIDRGLLVITHEYAGGTRDCRGYGLGPATDAHLTEARKITFSDTSCSTPAPRGRADLLRLKDTFAAERERWSLRHDALASLAPGERLADSRHPAAKTLRSLHHQRKWWQSLTAAAKETRRIHRRTLLGTLTQSDRSAWFDWLNRRSTIVEAAQRITAWTAAPDDLHTVLTAPHTVHRGMRDPRWRDSATPVVTAVNPESLQLCFTGVGRGSSYP